MKPPLSSDHNYRPILQNCSDCAGRGQNPCSACVHGFKTCRYCSGVGSVVCSNCQGARQVPCDGCNGQGGITSFLYVHQKFAIDRSQKSFTSRAFCDAFAKDFRTNFEEKLNQEARQLFKAIRPEWVGDDFNDLCNDSLKTAAKAFVAEAKAKEEQRSSFNGSHIVRQKFAIFQEDVSCVEYRCFNKAYQLYVYGKSGTVWAKESPVSEIEQNRISEAEVLFEAKKYSEAVALMRKAMAMAPSNKKYSEFLEQILKEIKKQYLWGGAVGGTLTIPVAGTLFGLGVGSILNHVFSDRIKMAKKRFFLSFGITALLDALIVAFVFLGISVCSVNTELTEIGIRLKNYSGRKAQLEAFGAPRKSAEYDWLTRKITEESVMYYDKFKKVSWLGIQASPYALRAPSHANRSVEPRIRK